MADGSFFDAGNLPSWMRYEVAAESIIASAVEEDIEDTLLVQLTLSEVGLVTFGAHLVSRLFPEVMPTCASLSRKLVEVSGVQEFFQPSDMDGDE